MSNLEYNGQVLTNTRRELKLKIDDIATELCLSVQQVQAIENNLGAFFHSNKLKQAVIKRYCRFLNIDINAVITQYFYNAEAYFYFVERCEQNGITVPIVPGIMPITQFSQLSRFSEMCGADIPRWLRKRLEAYGDDRDSIQALGLDFVSQLCQRLLDNGAPGIHFYTMNQAAPSLAIIENLSL